MQISFGAEIDSEKNRCVNSAREALVVASIAGELFLAAVTAAQQLCGSGNVCSAGF